MDYYKILKVSHTASANTIRKAYIKLALKWHPDKNPHDPERATRKFKEISYAYQILSDEKNRRKYDRCNKAFMDASNCSVPRRRKGAKITPLVYHLQDPNEFFNDFFRKHLTCRSFWLENMASTLPALDGSFCRQAKRRSKFTNFWYTKGAESWHYNFWYHETIKKFFEILREYLVKVGFGTFNIIRGCCFSLQDNDFLFNMSIYTVVCFTFYNIII